MTRGIFIVAFGKPGYGFAAWNLAFSLKKFSPEIPITLFAQPETISQLSPERQIVFDDISFIPNNLLYPFDPGRLKLNLYEYLPYDINLYLDVDALALRDITPAFDDFEKSGKYFATQINAKETLAHRHADESIFWAKAEDIYEHFNLPEDAVLPSTNSSWQFIKKGDEAKRFFERVRENHENPLPLSKQTVQWGGTQPDELYINVTMAQLGWHEPKSIMFFGRYISKEYQTFEIITKAFPLLSIFGGQKITRKIYLDWYDRLMQQYCRESGIEGLRHDYKTHYINRDKHLNNPVKLSRRIELAGNGKVQPFTQSHATMHQKAVGLQKALIPISETKVVDSKKLIQFYEGPKKERVKVTNWFNCSVCEYKGKKYFAYRMEAMPWCTKMKIGLCLLDDDLQPIQGTNVIPKLHTSLPPFAPGFHCEDPRLFVYNDELYLSYTDGYQMGQAKINPVTLEAEESFYIEKPDPTRTEKNWTFFESDGKLYSVYNIAPHIIFEMEGKNWTEVARTNYVNSWRWGTIRGGTSPQRDGDYFISFFHSAVDSRNQNKGSRQYFMGAYLFESTFPFKPVAITKEPLLAGEDMNPHIPRLSNRIYVVFPNGKFRTENGWMVSLGYNDYDCRFIEIPDTLLEEQWIPVHGSKFKLQKELV